MNERLLVSRNKREGWYSGRYLKIRDSRLLGLHAPNRHSRTKGAEYRLHKPHPIQCSGFIGEVSRFRFIIAELI